MASKKQPQEPNLRRELWTIDGKRRVRYVVRERGKIRTAITAQEYRKNYRTREEALKRFKEAETLKPYILRRKRYNTEVALQVRTTKPKQTRYTLKGMEFVIVNESGEKQSFYGFGKKGDMDVEEDELEYKAIAKAIKSGFLTYDQVKNENYVITSSRPLYYQYVI